MVHLHLLSPDIVHKMTEIKAYLRLGAGKGSLGRVVSEKNEKR